MKFRQAATWLSAAARMGPQLLLSSTPAREAGGTVGDRNKLSQTVKEQFCFISPYLPSIFPPLLAEAYGLQIFPT